MLTICPVCGLTSADRGTMVETGDPGDGGATPELDRDGCIVVPDGLPEEPCDRCEEWLWSNDGAPQPEVGR